MGQTGSGRSSGLEAGVCGDATHAMCGAEVGAAESRAREKETATDRSPVGLGTTFDGGTRPKIDCCRASADQNSSVTGEKTCFEKVGEREEIGL